MDGPNDTIQGARARVEWLFYGTLFVLTTVTAWFALGLRTRPLDVPLAYTKDALPSGAWVKATVENGWYERNPYLGAPFGQVHHDYPVADHLQYAVPKLLGYLGADWASAYNLAYLLTFPLAAVTGAWFFRLVGARRASAFAMGALFAFTPYHFHHGPAHLALSQYFVVPLGMALIYLVLDDQPVWSRRTAGHPLNPMTWATRRTGLTLLWAGLLGSTAAYYTVFTLLLLGAATLVLLLRRRWRGAGSAVLAGTAIVVALLANMLPDLVHKLRTPASGVAFERAPVESEFYALKLAQLVLPNSWTRIDSVARWRERYDTEFPLPSELASLGLVATVGFVVLLLLPATLLYVRPARWRTWRSQRHLSIITLVAFLFGTVGGLGTIFALLVTPTIRAWSRLAIVIALVAYACVALLLDAALARLQRHLAPPARRGRVMAAGVCAVVLAVGLVDQVPPPTWNHEGTEGADWDRDAAYVAALEERMPPGAMIVQLPYLPYPESFPVYELGDYQPLRLYLHSTDLRWTFGGIKGRPTSEWTKWLGEQPPDRLVIAMVASGAAGVHIDRFGYPGRDAGVLEDVLRDATGEGPVESVDGRYAFFDLTGVAEELRADLGDVVVERMGERVVNQPGFYPRDIGFPFPEGGRVVMAGTTRRPSLLLINPGRTALTRISFSVRADGTTSPVPVQVSWPDGETQVVQAGTEPVLMDRTLQLTTGRTVLTLAAPAADTVSVLDFTRVDLDLAASLDRATTLDRVD